MHLFLFVRKMGGQKFTPTLHNFGCSAAITPQVGSNVVVSCSLHGSQISSNAPWKVWTGFILQWSVQGFPGSQHHEPHVCTYRSLSWPQPSSLNFYRCLSCYLSTDSKGAEARSFSVDSDQNQSYSALLNLCLLCKNILFSIVKHNHWEQTHTCRYRYIIYLSIYNIM